MKTIQISTTNLIYYLTMHPEYKTKLLAEILPPVEKVHENIIEGLEYDTVMDFDYLRQCYNESLRIEPPASSSGHATVDVDTTITRKDGKGQLLIKKDQLLMFNFSAIHHDPDQWIEPSRFVPDRFDNHAEDNKWVLTSDGKPRNPLAFTPFYGGKRVCLGKTFADITVRFTLPLIFHHLDFEFENPEYQQNNKPFYSVAGLEEPKIPMKLIVRNPVKI